MKITVLYFAGLREKLGCGSETLALPEGVQTVGDLRQFLIAQGREALAHARNLRCAVNQEMQGPEAVIRNGDEVAFFPPVTGG